MEIPAAGQDDEQRSTTDVLNSIKELSRLKEHFKNEIHKCLLAKTVSGDESTACSGVSREILTDDIKKARAQVTKERALLKMRDDISKLLIQSEEAYQAMYPDHFVSPEEDADFSANQKKILRMKMVELQELNKQILQLQEQKLKLKQRSMELDKEIEEVTIKNKESFQLLQHKRNSKNTSNEDLTYDERQDADNELKQLRCIKHVFQCVIQASRVDWSRDEELRQLVFELGKPDAV